MLNENNEKGKSNNLTQQFHLHVALTMTMTKSSQHQAFVKYTLKPRANHLINISMKNITVNIRSI